MNFRYEYPLKSNSSLPSGIISDNPGCGDLYYPLDLFHSSHFTLCFLNGVDGERNGHN
jgi:hypothetical protein